jgi:hypothetical protein
MKGLETPDRIQHRHIESERTRQHRPRRLHSIGRAQLARVIEKTAAAGDGGRDGGRLGIEEIHVQHGTAGG